MVEQSNCLSYGSKPHGYIHKITRRVRRHYVVDLAGSWLASGANADVHELIDRPYVVRFATVQHHDWIEHERILRHVRRNPNPVIARVLDFDILCEDEIGWLYSYVVTERLTPITDEDEGENVCQLFDAVQQGRSVDKIAWWNREKRPTDNQIARVAKNMKQCPFIHDDIHWGNIMKDDKGNYKLVDLEDLIPR